MFGKSSARERQPHTSGDFLSRTIKELNVLSHERSCGRRPQISILTHAAGVKWQPATDAPCQKIYLKGGGRNLADAFSIHL